MWRVFSLVLFMVMGCVDESKADEGSASDGGGASSHDHAEILERLDSLEADLAAKTAELAVVSAALAELESTTSASLESSSERIDALEEGESAVGFDDLDDELQDSISWMADTTESNEAGIADHEDRIGTMEGMDYVTEYSLAIRDFATSTDLELAQTQIAANEMSIAANSVGIAANETAIDSITSSVDLVELDARVTILEAVDYIDESAWMDVVGLVESLAETIETNTVGIVENMVGIETNAVGIASNTSAIYTTDESVAGNTLTIGENAVAIVANGTGISTNTADIEVNATDISTNLSQIAVNTSDLADFAVVVADVEDAVEAIQADVVPDLGDYISVNASVDEVVFSGANVLIQSGSGYTDDNTTTSYDGDGTGSLTGLGNLIVGYNEDYDFYTAEDRAGSHNLVVGPKGSPLQLTLKSVFYLSQPIENLPYTVYMEFLPQEERATMVSRFGGDPALAQRDGRYAPYVAGGFAIPLALGDYFGEFGILYKTQRTCNVLCRYYGTFARLYKPRFQDLMTHYP